MRSRFLNFGDDIHDQLVKERISRVRFNEFHYDLIFGTLQPRLVADSQLCHFSSSESGLIENERQSWQSWNGWCPCEIQEATGNMFLVEKPAGASRWNQASIKRLRNAPSRQVFDKQSTALEICLVEVPEQACSWTGERTHERLSEFVCMAHTRLGASGDARSGERRSQKGMK